MGDKFKPVTFVHKTGGHAFVANSPAEVVKAQFDGHTLQEDKPAKSAAKSTSGDSK
jgi:hypothetical protein